MSAITAFRFKRTKYGNLVFDGGPETGEALTGIESLGFTSPRKKPKPKRKDDGYDRLKWFDAERQFGFTRDGVFIHQRQVISGEPVKGARVTYDVKETSKGKSGVNVRVI